MRWSAAAMRESALAERSLPQMATASLSNAKPSIALVKKIAAAIRPLTCQMCTLSQISTAARPVGGIASLEFLDAIK
jgi:hypothetical protein